MLKKAATLKLDAHAEGDRLVVEAAVTNSGAGHPIPDGATLRNIILLVEARDSAGQPLQAIGEATPRLPPLAGKGTDPRDYAGHPGKMFARPFAAKNGMAPVGGFAADHVLFDTRIPPRQTDRSRYVFALPKGQGATVTARLIYRWTYKPMADRKGWKLDDIEMARQQIHWQP